eukprot:Nitzschia sp. Nitz4//scaffold87_size112219//102290//103348//NITZ4_004091-RA/size112219-processed-gene-0.117-mRNA-1//1//CDS//3329559420//8166//frame0
MSLETTRSYDSNKLTALARGQGWREWKIDSKSSSGRLHVGDTAGDAEDMLSFQKDSNRLQIYCSTNSLVFCLNHPKFGKTQILHRHASWEDLPCILQNPRQRVRIKKSVASSLSSEFYYCGSRKTKNQQWRQQISASRSKPTKRGSSTPVSPKYEMESDSARRWRTVAACTGLESRGEVILELGLFFQGCDQMLWDPDQLPQPTKVNESKRCALLSMLFEEAKLMYSDVQLLQRSEESQQTEEKGPEPLPCTMEEYLNSCQDGLPLESAQTTAMHHLQVKLRRFPTLVRTEVIAWCWERSFYGRDDHVMLATPNQKDMSTTMSTVVARAHENYGIMMYPKSWECSAIYGVFA